MRKLKGFCTRTSYFIVSALFASASFLTACSDDELAGEKSTPVSTETDRLLVNNNAEELSKRITLYKETEAQTKALENNHLSMPEQPTVPENAIIMDRNYKDYAAQAGASYVLQEGETLSTGVFLNDGTTYYVKGQLTLTNHWTSGAGGTFVILPGGSLDFQAGTLLDKVSIYNYGTFTIGSKKGNSKMGFTTNSGSTFMTNQSFECNGSLNISGDFYVGGDLKVDKFIPQEGGNAYVGGTVEAADIHVTNHSALYAEKLTADNFETNSHSKVTIGCSAYIHKKLTLTNHIDFHVLGYLQSSVTELTSDTNLHINQGCWMSLGDLSIQNVGTVRISVIGNEGEYGVVTAKNISVNQNDLTTTFTGYMGLHYESLTGNGSQDPIEFLSQILVNEKDKTNIAATECTPAFNATPDGDTNGDEETGDEEGMPQMVIDHIAKIEEPDHSHDISATCVYMEEGNDNAYVSWHKRGEEYDGCAEVIKFDTDTKLSLISFMRSEKRRDFNHCIVNNNTLYLVGGQKSGAIMAHVTLTSGGIFPETGTTETTQSEGIFQVIKFPDSGDANCVVRNDNYYIVAATNGFYVLNAGLTTLEMVKETPGSAKFIDLNGDDILTLNLDSRGTDAAGAEINVYPQNDYALASPKSQFSENVITPVNGKNVARLDGNHIYVCLGENGFQRYTLNGQPDGNFKLEGTNSLVNGMDYDDKYIYIAYGSEGLYVLDKSTLQVVASHIYSGGHSANYVKVVNGHIFVAYGRSGLQVFKLTEVKN